MNRWRCFLVVSLGALWAAEAGCQSRGDQGGQNAPQAQSAPAPPEILLQARSAAMAAGLRYVYVGNLPGQADVQNTFCPACKKALVERNIFTVTNMRIKQGKCEYCQTPIAGVWGM